MDGSLQVAASLIYQNPGASLNPVFTIGQQLRLVAGTDDPAVLEELLEQVGLPDPPRLLDSYPHELSGGMSQRAVIALALAQSPRLLIADEPTTALDVTTQAQVLDLIEELRGRTGLAVVLISHDLAVIRRVCDRIVVLYAGQVAEVGGVEQVLEAPSHPYTQALVLEPSTIILDEPTSALDVSVQAGVLNLLQQLKGDHGLTYLFITHDLGVARHLADRIAVMRTGGIVEQQPTEALFDNPEHSYTRTLLASSLTV